MVSRGDLWTIMADDILNIPPLLVSSAKMPWCENRPMWLRGKFEDTFKVNVFHTVPEALEAVNTHIVSLLTTNVKTWSQQGETGRGIKDFSPRVLARHAT